MSVNRAIAVAALLAAVACGDATGPRERAAVAGTYKLQMVNGWPLPYEATQYGRTPIEILSSYLTITDTAYRGVGNDAGDMFTDRWQGDTTEGPQYDYTYVAWRVHGGSLTITPLDGLDPIVGSVHGDTLVLAEHNVLRFPDGVYVYVKVPRYDIAP